MRGNLKVMRPRWRKVFSDLWANKLRTLLVVASISVGVFSVGTIATAYVIISEDMNVSYSSANPANIEISTDLFDESYVRSVENVDGVGEAEGRRIFKVRASLDREDWLGMDMVAIEDYTAANINQRYPVEAGSVPADREIVIEKELLKDMQVQVGDTLYIQLPDGTIRSMPVVGIVQDHTTSAGDFMGSPLGFISFDTLAWLQQPSYFNRLYATVEKGSNDETHMRYVAEEISDKLDRSHRETYQTTIKVSDEHPLTSTIMAALGILGALGVLMVLLSSSLIANTLSALLNQHLRQIGVMKLIGARSFQILGMYIVLILAFGVIALLISVPLSGQAGYALAEFAAYHFNFNLQGFHLVPLAVLLQVVIATLVPLAAGFLPVNSGSRTKVRRAISGDRPGATQTKTSWIERFGARFRWVSRPLVLSVRNTFRRKGRLVLTLFTLTMAGAIFIAVFNVRALARTIHRSIRRLLPGRCHP